MQFFIEFLKLAEGGDIFICKKQCTLCYIFIFLKQFTLRDVSIYKKPDTLSYILIFKKQCNLCYVFISKMYCVVLIPNYKRTYNQSNQIEK